MKSACLAAALMLAVAAPAFAADDTAKAKPAAASDKPADKAAADPSQKLICTRETQVGTILPKRVCRTQAQIDEERRATQRIYDDRRLQNGRIDVGR